MATFDNGRLTNCWTSGASPVGLLPPRRRTILWHEHMQRSLPRSQESNSWCVIKASKSSNFKGSSHWLSFVFWVLLRFDHDGRKPPEPKPPLLPEKYRAKVLSFKLLTIVQLFAKHQSCHIRMWGWQGASPATNGFACLHVIISRPPRLQFDRFLKMSVTPHWCVVFQHTSMILWGNVSPFSSGVVKWYVFCHLQLSVFQENDKNNNPKTLIIKGIAGSILLHFSVYPELTWMYPQSIAEDWFCPSSCGCTAHMLWEYSRMASKPKFQWMHNVYNPSTWTVEKLQWGWLIKIY